MTPTICRNMPTTEGAYKKKVAQNARLRLWIASTIAFLLSVSFIVFFKYRSKSLQVASFILLCIPAIAQMAAGMVDFSRVRRSFSAAFPYLLMATISTVVNLSDDADGETSLVLQASVWFGFIIASIFASWKTGDLSDDIMRAVGICILPVFLYVYLTERASFYDGRWFPYWDGDSSWAHPNWWGLIALGLAWCSFKFKNPLLRLAGIAVAAYFMFLVQSRGAIVALFATIVFCSGSFFPVSLKKIALIFVILLFGISIALDSSSGLFNYVGNKILLLNDPDRGAGTGMTGRSDGYVLAWEAFKRSPFFGEGLSEYSFVHDGFLTMLGGGGVFTLFGFLYLFCIGMWRYLKHRNIVGLGFIISYMVLLLTYNKTFNINVTSFLMMVILMKGASLK